MALIKNAKIVNTGRELPNGGKVEKVCVPRYRSTFEIATLLEAARAEFPDKQLKILLLAAMAGLRRNEIDNASSNRRVSRILPHSITNTGSA
jgi:hypothetical protein